MQWNKNLHFMSAIFKIKSVITKKREFQLLHNCAVFDILDFIVVFISSRAVKKIYLLSLYVSIFTPLFISFYISILSRHTAVSMSEREKKKLLYACNIHKSICNGYTFRMLKTKKKFLKEFFLG
jgi:hypothetical protein